MQSIRQKLQFKNNGSIFIYNYTEDFSRAIGELSGIDVQVNNLTDASKVKIYLFFVKNIEEINNTIPYIHNIHSDEQILRYIYPKQSSKKHKSTINRDKGRDQVNDLGFETVRAVSIDDNWTGLRFRNSNYK